MSDRHSRQLVLPEVGPAGQAKLQKARVVVVGAGGLGAPVISQLAAAGVGAITIIDDDVVEASNLNRQWLFTMAGLGKPKAEVAAAFVSALDPAIRVKALVERLTLPMALQVIPDHDVVVDCADGFPTKYLLNDVAVRTDRPLVHGAATAWSGQVLVVPGARGPCLRCLFPKLPLAKNVPTCRSAGIVAPTTGLVGSLQAAEVLKCVLMGADFSAGRFVAVDAKDAAVRVMRFTADAACPACGEGRTAMLQAADYRLRDDDDDDDDGDDDKDGDDIDPTGKA
jgi:adenylyltransferase/sulfurtransferase